MGPIGNLSTHTPSGWCRPLHGSTQAEREGGSLGHRTFLCLALAVHPVGSWAVAATALLVVWWSEGFPPVTPPLKVESPCGEVPYGVGESPSLKDPA